MKLKNIMKNIEFSCDNQLDTINDIEVIDIAYDSRKASEGYIFVCIKGETVDGHKYASKAYENGCRVFLVEEKIDVPDDAIVIYIKDSRSALSKASANFFGNPSSKLKVIGVTGTKGKTTITNYISGVLNNAGINTGVIGTNGTFYNNISQKTVNTTPESYELQKIFKKMLDSGVECVSMEVSSGGIMMNRVRDVEFDVGIFSNLSPDHIGPKEHPTFEHYLNCKAELFRMCKHGIINIDDEYANQIINKSTCDIETFGLSDKADIFADKINYSKEIDSLGVNFECNLDGNSFECYICSPGLFSVYNALAVISVCNYLGVKRDIMLDAIEKTKVKGRAELLKALEYATIVIDYAHNGVSLQSVLETLKEYKPNRLICLFGSVGGRTKGRRKELGDVASRECDFCIITSDNPDFEDPQNICEEIAKSFENSKCDYEIITDRKKAIEYAMNIAKEGDIIVFAGKGHEEYQLIEGKRVPFNERDIALDAVKEMKLSEGEFKNIL